MSAGSAGILAKMWYGRTPHISPGIIAKMGLPALSGTASNAIRSRRISVVMHNGNLKSHLKSILERHEGKARAIPGRELASMVGHRDDRSVRMAIRELISDGLPVASSTESPPGYFIVANRQEAEQYALSIRSRLIEDAIRRRDFRRAADQHLTPAVQRRLI